MGEWSGIPARVSASDGPDRHCRSFGDAVVCSPAPGGAPAPASPIDVLRYLAPQGTLRRVVATADVLSQLRRGALEFCVLALVAHEEQYAFDIVRTLGQVDGMVTAEGTIYPLLSRLKKDGRVTTSWRDSDAGPPRKYYAITAEGRRALADFTTEWHRFRDAVEALLAKGTA